MGYDKDSKLHDYELKYVEAFLDANTTDEIFIEDLKEITSYYDDNVSIAFTVCFKNDTAAYMTELDKFYYKTGVEEISRLALNKIKEIINDRYFITE